ncbi:MAG: hypothetical protein D6751_10035 [Deltaproteobacteria bacterium]|nr:MAG: hypothetical protein D6751_10035 [Deltaproteobacteria bacterium]
MIGGSVEIQTAIIIAEPIQAGKEIRRQETGDRRQETGDRRQKSEVGGRRSGKILPEYSHHSRKAIPTPPGPSPSRGEGTLAYPCWSQRITRKSYRWQG